MRKPNEKLFGTVSRTMQELRAPRVFSCRFEASHLRADSALLFRSELENVIDQQFCLILIIALERSGRRAGKNPVAVFSFEEAGRHGSARGDGLRVNDPALHPIGLQAAASLQEIRCGGEAIVGWIASGVTLQARGCGAAEEAARHLGFFRAENGNLFRNVREGLARKSLEKAHQFAKFVFGDIVRGHADLEVRALTVAVVVFVVQGRVFQVAPHPFGVDARALGEELGRKLLLCILVASHSHKRRLLAGDELVAAHAVIFLDYPPALLNVAAIIQRAVLIAGGKRIFLAAQKESSKAANLLLGEVQVRHAEFFGFGFFLALVPDVGFGEFVLEETLLVVPGVFGRAFGQTRFVICISDRFAAAALGDIGEQSEIQALDWFAAFDGQLGADAAFFLEAGDFMASGAAEVTNPLLAFIFQIWIVLEGGIGVGGRLLLFQSDEIAGDVFGVLRSEAEAGHHGHVLDLELMAVVGAAAVVEVENVGQALLFVVFGADVFLFVGAVGTGAFAGVVDPTNQVVVVVLFTDASEICGKSSALQLVAFADGVAGEAAARFEQLFSVSGVAGLVLGQLIGERRLPDEGGDGFDLFVVEAEIRHFGGGAEVARFLQPNRDPILI